MKDVLRFKKGYKNWNVSFNVKINYEYTSELQKELTTVEITNNSLLNKISIPWYILKPFLMGQKTPYMDSSGLEINVGGPLIIIRNGLGFEIEIQEDQANSILIACERLQDDISPVIQKLRDE